MDQWRDRLKVVDQVNSGSFAVVLCYVAYMRSKNMHAFCYCASSDDEVLWQKVNVGNIIYV